MRAMAVVVVSIGCVVSPASAQAPEPLLELGFGGHLRNSGTLGGEGQRIEYAPGEGPAYGLGVVAAALDVESSSRSGGRDETKAGGAVEFTDAGLAGLRQFTLSLWLKPADEGGPARLLYLPGEWDLMIGAGSVSFKLETDDGIEFFHPERDAPRAALDRWSFLALSVDLDAHTAAMYLAADSGPVAPVARWEGLPEPGRSDGALQIGNLAGIRPFRGLIDNVRIYPTALSEGEVAALHQQDSRQARRLADCVIPRGGTGVPGFAHSDVCFSTRWGRDNAVEAIQAFRANRVVWVYTSDAEFVRSVHETGATIQGAINSVPRTEDLSAYAIDLDGTKLVAPWMVNFNKEDPVKWGCSNQPAFREVVLKNARAALDAGVDWLQFDDGALLVSCHSWGGGCMCDRCMEAFRKHLAELPAEKLQELGIHALESFDYRKFLAETHDIHDAAAYKQRRGKLPTTPVFTDWQHGSVRSYFTGLRAELDRHAGRRVPLSINHNLTQPSQERGFLNDIVDFFLGETWSPELADLAICARAALALGKHQIVSPFPHNVADTRLSLAATYALGELYLVPWDVWMGPDKPRHFGTVEEYGDLYHFVRDSTELLDAHEAVGIVGVIVNTDRYDHGRTKAVVNRLLRAQVPFAFVLTGHKYYDLPVEAEALGRFSLLIRLDELDTYVETDREAIEAAGEEVAVLSVRQATQSVLSKLAPLEVWGPDDIYALPRVSGDPDSRALICHLLNRNQAGEGEPIVPLRYLSIGLRRSAFLGPKIAGATWHAPGRQPRALEMDELSGLTRLIIPELAEWGIAQIEFGE